jgi:glycosyltransferase involved in cell wall biosynthesis
VLTAHDYKLVCPSYSLHDGNSNCFACRGHRYWNVLVRGCSRKGHAGDVALAAEAYVHHFTRVYERNVDLVIAPSRYLCERLVEGGFSPRRVRLLPNAIAVSDYRSQPNPGDYLLFVGRLSYEKGLPTLIDAARRVPGVPLWIVGDGPLCDILRQQASDHPNLRFLGRRPPHEVRSLLEGCRALVLSSEVPENCPLSILEAFATGKPVIATSVGGVPELFEESVGVVVPPGQPEALAAAMSQLWSDRDRCRHLGLQARRYAESRHDLSDYVAALEAVYESLAHGPPADANSAVGPEFRCSPRDPVIRHLDTHSMEQRRGA